MTRDEILAMEPGRELDALVAEKVLGLIKDDVDRNLFKTAPRRYSTDISAAFVVWEHDRPKDWYMDLHWSKGKYVAEIIRESPEDGYEYLAQVEADTAAEAVVKARLLAVMDNETN